MDLTDKNQLIEYLKSRGLYTQKKLGQNFLVDRKALDAIVEAAELTLDDCVIEIGPGLGVLTEELVKRAGKVIAVELDQKLARLLGERLHSNVISSHPEPTPRVDSREATFDIAQVALSASRRARNPAANAVMGSSRRPDTSGLPQDDTQEGSLLIVNSDILRVNIPELMSDCPSHKVVANIPYYITSKILRLFLEAQKKPTEIVMLTQKEVAERICAKPGDLSQLAISVQVYGEPEIVSIVPRNSFFPAPEVDSAILRIFVGRQSSVASRFFRDDSTNDKRQTTNEKDFFRCVAFGFSSRRKTLLNNLSAGYRLDKPTTLAILEKVGLVDKTRAQELTIEQWMVLCREFGSKGIG